MAYRRPEYTGVDTESSKYASHKYENNQLVFTVEQGTQFYLKLNLKANPWPTSYSLSKDGNQLQLLPARGGGGGPGTIYVNVDSFNIQSVQNDDAGTYTLSCSNRVGNASFSFRLRVEGKALILIVRISAILASLISSLAT